MGIIKKKIKIKAKNFVKEEFVNNIFSKSLDKNNKAIQLNWFNLLR